MLEFERLRARLYERAMFGMIPGLERMNAALQTLGHPESAYPSVHVAGTNGKGSTSAFVESIARAAGLRTALYTSPHLCTIRERIRLDGQSISEAEMAGALATGLAFPDLTFFEVLTVAAMVAFHKAKVDLAIFETGLGGRHDATNVLPRPLVTAITSIGLDHTEVLGPTLLDIADEKSGIFKQGASAIVGPTNDSCWEVLQARAIEVRAKHCLRVRQVDQPGSHIALHEGHIVLPPMRSGLVPVSVRDRGLGGAYQQSNAAMAVAIAWDLAPTWPDLIGAIQKGLAQAQWPGRFELVERGGRRLLLDCAHNPDGAQALVEALRADLPSSGKITLLFGALADKNADEMLRVLAPIAARRIFTHPQGRAPHAADKLASAWGGLAILDPQAALAHALASSPPEDAIVVTGSSYLVGEIRGLVFGLTCDPVVGL